MYWYVYIICNYQIEAINIYIYHFKYLSLLSFVCMKILLSNYIEIYNYSGKWIDLENILLSDVTQAQKQ